MFMTLNLEAKQAIVEQVSSIAKNAIAVGVANYSGLTVAEMTKLRTSALHTNVVLKVVKNTLAKRALKKTNCACIEGALTGQVILGFAEQDPGAVARIFHQFKEKNEDLVVTALGISGDFIAPSELKRIADLPTKDQSISLIMTLILAPVERLVKTLNEVPSKITRTISVIAKQK